jgi:hypothetical protein
MLETFNAESMTGIINYVNLPFPATRGKTRFGRSAGLGERSGMSVNEINRPQPSRSFRRRGASSASATPVPSGAITMPSQGDQNADNVF